MPLEDKGGLVPQNSSYDEFGMPFACICVGFSFSKCFILLLFLNEIG